MRHHESTFFCEKGEIPKVQVKSTGDNHAYEAYISFVGANEFSRQITIFFATVEDLREFVDSLVSETYSIKGKEREGK
jgi:hypothetical protein